MSKTSTEKNNDVPAASELIPADKIESITPGLQDAVGSVEPLDAFGDSGDRFDHAHWRPLFRALAGTKSGSQFMLGIAQKLLLRGQTEKRLYKGQAVRYNFSTNRITQEEKEAEPYWEGVTELKFVINFPKESSRVNATDLTPERVKCCIRPYIVSSMVSAKRLPATAMASGYGKLVLDYQTIMAAYGTLRKFSDAWRQSLLESDAAMEMTRKLNMSAALLNAWRTVEERVAAKNLMHFVTITAAFAGSISSKEIYDYDENLIAGTVFWSGLHALMTDISCKNKATMVTADLRERYKMASFYDDFKRKMISREMHIINTPHFINFLRAFSVVIPIYIFSTTQIKTEEETSLIDEVMKAIESLKSNPTYLAKQSAEEDEPEITHQTPGLIKQSIMKRTAATESSSSSSSKV